MNLIKWFFTSKYKKLLYQIKVARSNQQRLHLPNGVILDFFPGHEYDSCKSCASPLEDGGDKFSKYIEKIGQTVHIDVYDCFGGDVKILAVGKDRIFIEIIYAVSCYSCQVDPLPGEKHWVGYWEIAPELTCATGFTEGDLPF